MSWWRQVATSSSSTPESASTRARTSCTGGGVRVLLYHYSRCKFCCEANCFTKLLCEEDALQKKLMWGPQQLDCSSVPVAVGFVVRSVALQSCFTNKMLEKTLFCITRIRTSYDGGEGEASRGSELGCKGHACGLLGWGLQGYLAHKKHPPCSTLQ